MSPLTDDVLITPTVADQPSYMGFQRYMFDLVDRMKTLGLAQSIDLPQLVVCGDQSSGKSSVLSSITRLDFPTKDTLCMMFPTELIMRQTRGDQSPSFSIRILPSEKRNQSDRLRLQSWRPSTADLGQFHEITTQAGIAMYEDTDVTRFTEDVLRIEMQGSDLQNLDLVDLPGLFHSAGPKQTFSDVEKVKQLVLRYMAKKRTVVLAVISAKDDLAGQVVTNLVGQCQATDRTLAVITKADTLDEEPNKQRMFIEAMQNNLPELSFGLGWHALRNKKYSEQNFSWEQRDKVEANFFRAGGWARISEKQKGIAALVLRLQTEQGVRIAGSVEAMTQELALAVRRDEEQLATMQPKMRTLDVLSISQKFCDLVSKAVGGVYTHDIFETAACRLAQKTEGMLASFATQMRTRGHKWNITTSGANFTTTTGSPQPLSVKRSDLVEMLSDKLAAAGAMPGQFIQEVFDDVFYEQAQAWPTIIRQTVDELLQSVNDCVMAILRYVCQNIADPDKVFNALVKEQLDPIRIEFEAYVNDKIKALTSRSEISLGPMIKNQIIPSAFREEWRSIVQARVPDLAKLFEGLGLHSPIRVNDGSQAKLVKSVVDIMIKEISIQRFSATVMEASLEHYYEAQLEKTIAHLDFENVHHHLLSKLPSLFPQMLAVTADVQAEVFIAEDPDLVEKRTSLSDHLKKLRTLHEEMRSLRSQKNLATRKRRFSDTGDEPATGTALDKKAKRAAGDVTPKYDRRR